MRGPKLHNKLFVTLSASSLLVLQLAGVIISTIIGMHSTDDPVVLLEITAFGVFGIAIAVSCAVTGCGNERDEQIHALAAVATKPPCQQSARVDSDSMPTTNDLQQTPVGPESYWPIPSSLDLRPTVDVRMLVAPSEQVSVMVSCPGMPAAL